MSIMPMTLPIFPLMQAVHERLAGQLLSAANGGVYVTDEPPENKTYPYVQLGEIQVNDYSTKTGYGTELFLPVYVWSAFPGTMECASIMSAVTSLIMNSTPLVLDGYACNTMLPKSGQITELYDEAAQRKLRCGILMLRFLVFQTAPLMYYVWGTEADNNAITFMGNPWQAVICWSAPPVVSPLPPVLDRSSDLSAYNLPVTIAVDVGAAGSGVFELATLFTGCWVNLNSRPIDYSGPPDAWYPFIASEVIASFNSDGVAQSMGITAGGYGVSDGTGLAVGLSIYPTPADVSPYQVWPPTS
jgi:hypothetical protein